MNGSQGRPLTLRQACPERGRRAQGERGQSERGQASPFVVSPSNSRSWWACRTMNGNSWGSA